MATTTFMPTLILVFKEETLEKYSGRTQLKCKINKLSEEITEQDIKKLKDYFIKNLESLYKGIKKQLLP